MSQNSFPYIAAGGTGIWEHNPFKLKSALLGTGFQILKATWVLSTCDGGQIREKDI